MADKMVECLQCGGWGGEPGSNFGDYGWHPCYKCGATGYVKETEKYMTKRRKRSERRRTYGHLSGKITVPYRLMLVYTRYSHVIGHNKLVYKDLEATQTVKWARVRAQTIADTFRDCEDVWVEVFDKDGNRQTWAQPTPRPANAGLLIDPDELPF